MDNLNKKIFYKADIEFKNIEHAFFTRNGGVSTHPIYNSLNVSFKKPEEDDANIVKNRQIILNNLSSNLTKLCTVSQFHSNEVCIIKNAQTHENSVKADAIVTKLKDIAIGVMTADCTPILLFDDVNKVIGAAHAGWQGAFKNIIKNTIFKMEEIGAYRKNIEALIGPTICQDNYEVDINFYNNAIKIDPNSELFFKECKNNKPNHKLFDLPGFCTYRLNEENIKNITNINKDTYSNAKEFFSYRRNFHENVKINDKVVCGNQISVIFINNDMTN